MKLIATPLSHFARKSRILLDLYAVPYTFVDIGNVAMTKVPLDAGNNPLMKVPVLEHENGIWLIESDHISSYIVSQIDPIIDKYEVNSKTISDLNIRAVLNGIMNEEVKVIVAGRHNVPVQNYSYFKKCVDVVQNGLKWIEHNSNSFTPRMPKYREFHLICMWEHLDYYDFVNLKNYPKVKQLVQQINDSEPILMKTAPFVLKPK